MQFYLSVAEQVARLNTTRSIVKIGELILVSSLLIVGSLQRLHSWHVFGYGVVKKVLLFVLVRESIWQIDVG